MPALAYPALDSTALAFLEFFKSLNGRKLHATLGQRSRPIDRPFG